MQHQLLQLIDGESLGAMRFYFDTNVASFIVSSGDANRVAHYFRSGNHRLVISTDLLVEVARAPSPERSARLDLLRAVDARFESPPADFEEAAEIRREISRCHPDWLIAQPDTAEIDRLLRGRREVWLACKKDPKFDLAARLPPYLEASGSAARNFADEQKRFKAFRRENPGSEITSGSPEIEDLLTPLGDFERYWRMATALAWRRAMRGSAAMRDYRDWLGPYVLPGVTDSFDWIRFWLTEVEGHLVKRTLVRTAIEYTQTSRKVTIGNAADTNHALYSLAVDRFLTCDRDFHSSLIQAMELLPFGLGSIRFVDRSKGNAFDAILDGLQGNRGMG